LRNYAVFYGVVTVVCTGWAIVRLRAVTLHQTLGKAKTLSENARRADQPYKGDQPMVWKEVTLDPGLQFNWFSRVTVLLLMIGSFIPPVWMVAQRWNWQGFQFDMNIWVRTVGTMVACLTLLGVAVRASSSISGERDRQTLDSLLTTPLDSDDMLYGKWLGSMMSVRWGWIWLGLIWGLSVVTGGLHVLALPLLAVAWAVYAAFLSSLGLYFSTVCRTTLRANIATLGTTLGLTAGHWWIWACCIPLMLRSGGGSGLEHIAMFQAFALTPPATLAGLAFFGPEFDWGSGNPIGEILVDCVLGLAIWSFGALVLWGMAGQRLRLATGRQHFRERGVELSRTMEQADKSA
jgi:ABC-type transport system involved in multi-copper enzyme maturation permease subunit